MACLVEAAILEVPTAVGMFRKPAPIDSAWLSGHALFSLAVCLRMIPGYLLGGASAFLNPRAPRSAMVWGAGSSLLWHFLLSSDGNLNLIGRPDFLMVFVAPALIGAALGAAVCYGLKLRSSM